MNELITIVLCYKVIYMKSNINNKSIDVLTKEYDRKASANQQTITQMGVLISLSITLLLILLGVGIQQGYYIAFYIVPPIIFWVGFLIISNAKSIMINGKVCEVIEEKINYELKFNCLIFETFISKKYYRSDINTMILYIGAGLFLTSLIVISLYHIIIDGIDNLDIFYLIFIFLLSLISIILIVKTLNTIKNLDSDIRNRMLEKPKIEKVN